jgi:surfeit locus 1 family protein
VLTLVGGLAVLAALVSLGTWQVHRLAWKEGLIAMIAERVGSLPKPLGEIEALYAENHDVDYWPVSASGTFRNESEVYFFATWQGASGYFVYTPLQLEDGRFLMVNRGFVPFDRKDPASRQEGQLPGHVDISGLARNPLAAKPSWAVPDNDLAKNVFYWKDLGAMAAKAGLPANATVLPFFVDAGPTEMPGGLPIGGVTMVDQPNNHLQYAVTWYGLAAVLVCFYGVWFWRLRRQSRKA